MRRILIIGTSGSGKTTLAKRLSNILNITAYDTDEYYWNPGWQPVGERNYTKAICSIIANESWVISGNFSNLQHLIWQRCDTIIWLDYSSLRCLCRALIRSIKRMITGQSCCNGNYENLNQLFFSKNSILLWVLKSYNKRREVYNKLFSQKQLEKSYSKLQNPIVLKIWLENIIENSHHNQL